MKEVLVTILRGGLLDCSAGDDGPLTHRSEFSMTWNLSIAYNEYNNNNNNHSLVTINILY